MTPDLLPLNMSRKVRVSETGCWEWTSYKQNLGYAQMSLDGRTIYAHRRSFELLIGPIPDGLEIDHLCRVRHCVNPEHMEPVTHRENCDRRPQNQATHCKRGHAFTPENTRYGANGRRNCRECQHIRDKGRSHKSRITHAS